jgi:hypothetical protein
MLEAFFPVFSNGVYDVELALRNALMHKNTANFHQTRAATRRTKCKLLRTFHDLQFRARPQSVTGPKRLWKDYTSEFIEFEPHRISLWHTRLAMANYFGNHRKIKPCR